MTFVTTETNKHKDSTKRLDHRGHKAWSE